MVDSALRKQRWHGGCGRERRSDRVGMDIRDSTMVEWMAL